MKTQVIGTTPVAILNRNKKRVRWFIQMLPTSVAAGNTGKIFIGRGFVPTATVGDPNQGEILVAGASIEEVKQFEGDTRPYKGTIWAVSDTANQQCVVEEEISEYEETKETKTE